MRIRILIKQPGFHGKYPKVFFVAHLGLWIFVFHFGVGGFPPKSRFPMGGFQILVGNYKKPNWHLVWRLIKSDWRMGACLTSWLHKLCFWLRDGWCFSQDCLSNDSSIGTTRGNQEACFFFASNRSIQVPWMLMNSQKTIRYLDGELNGWSGDWFHPEVSFTLGGYSLLQSHMDWWSSNSAGIWQQILQPLSFVGSREGLRWTYSNCKLSHVFGILLQLNSHAFDIRHRGLTFVGWLAPRSCPCSCDDRWRRKRQGWRKERLESWVGITGFEFPFLKKTLHESNSKLAPENG